MVPEKTDLQGEGKLSGETEPLAPLPRASMLSSLRAREQALCSPVHSRNPCINPHVVQPYQSHTTTDKPIFRF